MQRVEATEGTGSPRADRSRSPLLLLGGLALAAIVGIGSALYVLSRPDETASPRTGAGPKEESLALTNEEAIAKWDELHDLWLRSYRDRDATLIRLFAAPDAPTLTKDDEIQELLRNGVLDKTKFTRHSVRVISSGSSQIQIEEIVSVFPKFIDEENKHEVTVESDPQKQTVVWTMRRYGLEWKLYRSLIVSTEPISKGREW
jgi:hypothetical protein